MYFPCHTQTGKNCCFSTLHKISAAATLCFLYFIYCKICCLCTFHVNQNREKLLFFKHFTKKACSYTANDVVSFVLNNNNVFFVSDLQHQQDIITFFDSSLQVTIGLANKVYLLSSQIMFNLIASMSSRQ
jgi:hypothetical protein